MTKPAKIVVRAQWRNRSEDASKTVDRVSALLSSLAAIDPSFGEWFEKTSGRPSGIPIADRTFSSESLRPIVEASRDVGDGTEFSMGAWSGVPSGPSMSFDLRIGAHHAETPAFNHAQVQLTDERGIGSLVSFPVVRQVVEAVVRSMDPSSLDVMTRGWMLQAPDGAEFLCPAGGWMSYVKDGSHLTLPSTTATEHLADGLLLISTNEDFSDADPAHVVAGYELNAALTDIRAEENHMGRLPENPSSSTTRSVTA